MDVVKALAADLRDLAVDLTVGGYTREVLGLFWRDLRRCVPSALGATVVVVHAEVDLPISVNLVERVVEVGEVADTLRVPLPSLAPPLGGSVVLYAGLASALERLAADLRDTLGLPSERPEERPPLPVAPLHPGVSGLQDLSEVNRALGVLLNRGYPLDAARRELRRRASARDGDLVAAARALLDAL